jgi:hypothetical protein
MKIFVPIELKPGVHYRSEEELVISAADIGTTICRGLKPSTAFYCLKIWHYRLAGLIMLMLRY